MNKIYKTIIYSLSTLPLRGLYILSDLLYFLQTYIIKYRKKIVIENLEKSFPSKSGKEIQKLSNSFNKNLCDFMVEMLKGITISQQDLNRQITYKNMEVMHRFYKDKKNVMVLSGHIFNWEWLKGLSADLPSPDMYAVYHEASNQLINDIVKKSRDKYLQKSVSMSKASQEILRIPNDGNSIFLMVADQSPFKTAIRYDLNFMNQTTPVFQGFDILARRKNMGVVYINIKKKSRGKYIFEFIEITPDTDRFVENEIVHKYFALLEENIQDDPANYLWSHRRWKYKKGKDY